MVIKQVVWIPQETIFFLILQCGNPLISSENHAEKPSLKEVYLSQDYLMCVIPAEKIKPGYRSNQAYPLVLLNYF
jgi:hypothetical protein